MKVESEAFKGIRRQFLEGKIEGIIIHTNDTNPIELRKRIEVIVNPTNGKITWICGRCYDYTDMLWFKVEDINRIQIVEYHNNAKYTIWDSSYVHYFKGNMYWGGREPNPCKCFQLRHNGKDILIGGFYEWTSIDIINDFIKEEVN